MKKNILLIPLMIMLLFFIFNCSSTALREADKSVSTSTATETLDKKKDMEDSKSVPRGTIDTRGETTATTAPPADVTTKRTQKSGLSAGFVDDNKQFNRFTNSFLTEFDKAVEHYAIPVQERIILKLKDKNKLSLADAFVKVSSSGTTLAQGSTYADGTFLFFPTEHAAEFTKYEAAVDYAGVSKSFAFSRSGEREIDMVMDSERSTIANVPLDILFILDTTSSMGEEITRLKTTIEIIYSNIVYFSSKPKVRLGMVLFRDKGDEYVTKIVPLTENLAGFQAELDKVKADGGGDTNEDLQSALADSMTKISWSSDGIRLAFIITDAPPHLDYGQKYTYVNAVHDARQKGIKLFSIGSGELPVAGEYVLRQISEYTYAKYIFLTYGERGDSEGGTPGSVSHHVGTNFQTDKLESIVMQIAREELSFLTNQPLEPEEDYFQATKVEDEAKAETLKKLFDLAFNQLIDYSSIKLAGGTRLSILPFSTTETELAKQSEYFTEQSLLTMGTQKFFKLVDRENLQKILKEMEFQLSDLADETKAVQVGKLMGAEVLVSGKVYRVKDNYEIFIKLVRVETAEILSVTKVKIDKGLGL